MIDKKKIEEAAMAFVADKQSLDIIARNDLACGFKQGAKWADEYPYWHKTSEEAPEEGIEVLGYSENWIDEDFNPNGTRICYFDDFGWHSAKWNAEQDKWEAVGKEEPMCANCKYCEACKKNSDPEYWVEFPKFNK